MPVLFNNSLNRLVKQFIADQSGATSIEYALIAAGIALAIIAAVSSVGTKLATKYTSISTALK
jgi:pilus assembly protein Flp/PilA